MFLRQKIRRNDGKEHRTYSVVENKRAAGGRVVQRHVLYLGEINDNQELAWRKSIEVIEEGRAQPRALSLFPEDRCDGLVADASIVRLRLSQMRLVRPRQWGACWLALTLWRELQLDRFWAERLPASRKGTRWDHVLLVLVAYRLLAPGSEWRLHREWFEKSALADLLGEDFAVAEAVCLSRPAHRALAGNTTDNTTLRGFLDRIQRQYGKARRIWLMDRGIPTEATLAEMRAADPPVQYVVGRPKGRLSRRLEQDLTAKPWQQAREDVQVNLPEQDAELYVFAESRDRVAKERACAGAS